VTVWARRAPLLRSTASAESGKQLERARSTEGCSDVFAADVILVQSDGRELRGYQVIHELLNSTLRGCTADAAPSNIVIGGNTLASEIRLRYRSGAIIRTAGFWEFDEYGRVRRVRIYRQGA
jgi:hypothetical protein